MNTITIRTTVVPEDLERIRKIVESSGFFYDYEIDVAVELADTYLKEGEEKSGYSFVFTEQNGLVTGFASYGTTPCTYGTYDLYWIAVHNDFRNQGAGRILINEVHQRIKNSNGRLITAETSGTPKYIPTRKFYESMGYKCESIIKDFYLPGDDKHTFVFRF